MIHELPISNLISQGVAVTLERGRDSGTDFRGDSRERDS
jgi:hypothetical protein